MSAQIDSLLTWLQVIVAFGGVIFIHELGHFLAARRNGVRVEKFSVGFDFFGAKLWSKTIGDTEYVIGLFPLGGYVKMLGQEDIPSDDDVDALEPDSFQAKSVWARTQIISAGVIMNFLGAFVLCYAAIVLGFHDTPPQVGQVGYESFAEGLRNGDRLLRTGETEIDNWNDFFLEYVTRPEGSRIPVEVERDGATIALDLPVRRPAGWSVNMPDFGVGVSLTVQPVPGGPAEEGGVLAGDVIQSVDGIAIESWEQFSVEIEGRPERDVRIGVLRKEGETEVPREVRVTTRSRSDELEPAFLLGAEPAAAATVDIVVAGTPAEAAGFLPGDTVLSLGGIAVDSWYTLYQLSTYRWGVGDRVEAIVRGADGNERTLETGFALQDQWSVGMWAAHALGVVRAPEEARIGRILPGSAAETAGLVSGDVLRAATVTFPQSLAPDSPDQTERMELEDWNQLLRPLGFISQAEIELEFEREGSFQSVRFSMPENPSPRQVGVLGVIARPVRETIQRDPIAAIPLALKLPFEMLDDMVTNLQALSLGQVSPKALAGPVGIVTMTKSVAEESLGDLLNWLALISVNLALVNFLPIPVTDGGHFVFLMYEKLRGRRMDEEIHARFQWAGLLFLLMLFVFVTYNDILRLITGRF